MKYLACTVSVLLISTVVSFSQTKKVPAKPAAKTTTPAKAAPAKTAVASKMSTELDSVAYSIGMNIAQNLKGQGLDKINVNLLAKGIQDVLKGGKGDLDDNQAQMILGNYFNRLQSQRQSEEAKKFEGNKLEGEKFLEENKKKTGVVTLPSGLQYEVLKAGEGPKPTINNTVKTHYHGTLIDGTIFDSSVKRGQPAEFPVGGVIQGWVEALQLMPVGSKWKLYVPYNLAYGERAAGQEIKPYSTLIFEVELLEIVK
ncbi:FKBP-type peptidyl-prolyl cis-trans isomerase [Runella sp.]|uniref:FKBP-type peptidyl-prolyl cis-trans isomerase n=1 Tax=Runella sp. TaxID=1960881 RepID=UPI003D131D31